MSDHTERDILDALHRRYCRPIDSIRPARWVMAEHVPNTNNWGRSTRILDAVAVDCWAGVYSSDPAMGYGLEGFEVKVSKSDLRRELIDLTKSGAFTDTMLTTFSIVAPSDVLHGWRDMGIPAEWGVMAYSWSQLRYLRKPKRLREQVTVGIESVACLSRAVAKTATHCARIHPEYAGGAA